MNGDEIISVSCPDLYDLLFYFVHTVKPVAVHIMVKEKFVSADKHYDIECKSSGSRPAATITWHKGGDKIVKSSKNVSCVLIKVCFAYVCYGFKVVMTLDETKWVQLSFHVGQRQTSSNKLNNILFPKLYM